MSGTDIGHAYAMSGTDIGLLPSPYEMSGTARVWGGSGMCGTETWGSGLALTESETEIGVRYTERGGSGLQHSGISPDGTPHASSLSLSSQRAA
eukprot:389669-Rhodomonas_salina.1